MKTLGKRVRRCSRRVTLANFKFYLDEEIQMTYDGLTLNVSELGFGFLTMTEIRQGQTITVTSNAMKDFPCRKAEIKWVKRSSRYVEAGAEFRPGDQLRCFRGHPAG